MILFHLGSYHTGKEYTSGILEDYLIIAVDSKGTPLNREDYSLSYPAKSVYVTDDDDSEGWRVKFKKPATTPSSASHLTTIWRFN